MAHQPVAWFIEAGTSKTFSIQLTQDDGTTPLDLAQATTIRFVFKAGLSDLDSAAKITKDRMSGVSVMDAAQGDVTVDFLPVDTAIFYAGAVTLQWAAKVYMSQTKQVYGAYGTLLVQPLGVSSILP